MATIGVRIFGVTHLELTNELKRNQPWHGRYYNIGFFSFACCLMGAFRLLGLLSVVILGGGWQGGMAAVELFLGMAGTTRICLLALATTTMYTLK